MTPLVGRVAYVAYMYNLRLMPLQVLKRGAPEEGQRHEKGRMQSLLRFDLLKQQSH